ncbi:glucose-methanol-choline oxidoreductase, partial [Diplogelasinospora grovesii]
LGILANTDSLGGDTIGVMYQPNSIDPTNSNRSYSVNAYLPRARANLKVLTDITVARVNLELDGESDKYRATGVTPQVGTVITARKEVILSAGVIQSPNLLELSGVGQQSVLSAAGIPQIIDLPGVGENYQDHIRVAILGKKFVFRGKLPL